MDDDRFGTAGSRSECSKRPADPLSSAVLPVEQRLRSRIDTFLGGYGLTRMGKAVALSWIQSIGSDTTGDFARVRGWLLGRLNAFGSSGRQTPPRSSRAGISQWQEGCPEIIPGLRSKAFWSAEDFERPWVTDFEKGSRDARKELLALRGRGGFQPYRAPRGQSRSGETVAANDGVGSHCHQGGDWNVFYLFLHDAIDFSENRSKCPKTVSLVEALPRHHKHAFLSALAPGTHVVKHNGPTNKKLRVHLPLLAPGGGLSRLRVGSETREVVEGRALVFDDSFEHEAWNDDDHDEAAGNANVNSNHDDDSPPLRGVPREVPQDNEAGRYPRPCRGAGQERHGCSLDEEQGGAVERRDGRRRAATRVTLIADIWHPDLSNREVRFLSFLQEAVLRLQRRMVEARRVSRSVLQHHRTISNGDRSINIVSADSDYRLQLLSPPTPTTISSGDCNGMGNGKIVLPVSRRSGHSETRASAVLARLSKTAIPTATVVTNASAAGGERADSATDNPGGGGDRSSTEVGERCTELFLEDPERSVGTVPGGSACDGACDAGGPAVVDGDNFLEVINRARELCSEECNIFGA